MHSPSLEGNFCDKHGKAMKPAIIQDYDRHMGYVDKSDHMTNSYSSSRWTWKWTKKLFFHLMDLTILNSFIILASCGSKLSHQQFRLILVRDLIQEAEGVPWHRTARRRRQALSMIQIQRLDSRHNRCWLMQCKRVQCRVCSTKSKEMRMKCKYQECNMCATHVSRYFRPKCIFENHLTQKWKSETCPCK